MATRYGWDDDVRHHLSQMMPGPQADDLVAALKKEHSHDIAKKLRAIPLSGVEAGVRDALVAQIEAA